MRFAAQQVPSSAAALGQRSASSLLVDRTCMGPPGTNTWTSSQTRWISDTDRNASKLSMQTMPWKVVCVVLYDSKWPGSELSLHRLRASCDRYVSSDISRILTRRGQPYARIAGIHFMSTTHRFNTVIIVREQLIQSTTRHAKI